MDKSIGNILKKARRERGLKLPEVSSKLCISKSYLRALEGDVKDNLPAKTFTIGFLRTYATHLGLNADELVDKAKGVATEDVPTLEVNVPEPAHDSTMPSLVVLIVIAGAIASLTTGYSYFADNKTDAVASPQVTPQQLVSNVELQSLNNAPQQGAVVNLAVTNDVPVEASLEHVSEAPVEMQDKQVDKFVEIRATKDTWMMIAGSDDNSLFDNIIKKGEVYRAPVGKGLHLTTGNAGGLEFFHSGNQLSMPSGSGVILNAIALDQVMVDPATNLSKQQKRLP